MVPAREDGGSGLAFYVTGASGFLGGQIVRDLRSALPAARVYLPLRAKKQESAAARFAALFGQHGDSCVLLETTAPIPRDTTHLILNAYSISFKGDIADVLRANVAPMLALLDQCKQLPRLVSALVVSTAFVQPPLPFKLCKTPIPCAGSDNPFGLYDSLLAGKVTWEDLKADPRNHPHTTQHAPGTLHCREGGGRGDSFFKCFTVCTEYDQKCVCVCVCVQGVF